MTITTILKPVVLPLFAIALAALGHAGPATAQYQFETAFGGFGSAVGQFDDPRGVAVENGGQIVIAESGNDRIQLCNDQGACTAFGIFGMEPGQFDRPRGVAVGNNNRLYIADRGNDRIQDCSPVGVCTAFGSSGPSVGEFDSPRGVAVAADGRVVVSDTDNDRIQICSATGACAAFGSFGAGLGQFNSPAGVAVNSDGQILVADRGNDRIQVCTEQGNCSAFGSTGSSLGQFDSPTGVAVDSQDRIVIVDRINDRVQICSDAGACTAFGSTGSGDGQFDRPWGVAVDADDRIIVADLGNNRIQIFARAEPPPPEFHINAGLNDAWFDPATAGQGLFITVFPEIGRIFVAWFTYELERPDDSVTAILGEPGHRWLTAFGPYDGNVAELAIEVTSGGVFDAPEPPVEQVNDGTLLLQFSGCNSATVVYDMPSLGLFGEIPIQRIALDNVAYCESLAGE
jgi:DNA-binding beta-propeller fold protein YncE